MKERKLNIRKAFVFSVIINSMQILMMIAILLYLLIADAQIQDRRVMEFFITVAAIVVAVGAVFDIRDAMAAERMVDQVDSMDQTIEDMAELNNTLRVQRHDFLNHLQVVYSLIEMQEYEEANAYIERVYGSITSVSRAMKTANPAVNALLQVKLAACEKAGVETELAINSNWSDLPMPGWEMCKVLSNLIDNAIEALKETENPKLAIQLTEDLHNICFSVQNNGPVIPEKIRQSIFQPGFSTKKMSAGHGMGLYIVRQTLKAFDGDVTVESAEGNTTFRGFVPKAKKDTESLQQA